MIKLSRWSWHHSKSSQGLSARGITPTSCARSHGRSVTTVQVLSSWTVDTFRKESFVPQIPTTFEIPGDSLPGAIAKWFLFDGDKSSGPFHRHSSRSELNLSFWKVHGHNIVPLEITTSTSDGESPTFIRIDAPLNLLLYHMGRKSDGEGVARSVYLAQHDLRDLPQSLQDDLPTPDLVMHAGKGDLYSSSLWLGRSPTYTPLHRDPNPNLFMQLAGTKVIRLFRPDIGDAIFDHTTKLLNQVHIGQPARSDHHLRSASLRGEEMMMGRERSILHDLVWGEPSNTKDNSAILQHAQEASIGLGQVLFIPKGWWHSVKGVGDGVTASANWWFR